MEAADFLGHYFIACGPPCDSDRPRVAVLGGHLLGERKSLHSPGRAGEGFAEPLLCLLQRLALSVSQSQEGEQMVTCFCQ